MAKWLWVMWLLPAVALAQAPAIDGSQPIDITADELEVRQDEKQAIFRGNVIAKQGDITMTSARMIVHYIAGGQQSAASGAQGISKIEADGGVRFVSPTESAQASKATYDVNAEKIFMGGNVTLQRDQSIVKGEGLIYNLKTGRSILNARGGAAEGGRVRGLFVPSQNGE